MSTIIHFLYTKILKPILFMRDPEDVHDHMTNIGILLGKFTFARWLASFIFSYKNPILEQDILGIHFANPVGLSAGFDKNGELADILPSVGFGFAEIGTVTGEPCEGNPKPRLWREPETKSIRVYYGLKNDGPDVVSKRIASRRVRGMPLGMSVGATNIEQNMDVAQAVADFTKAYVGMEPVADYITLNISCPNTCSDQPFLIPANLELLLQSVQKMQTKKPIFIKLSPDISNDQIDVILEIIGRYSIQGIICSNLTKKHGTQNNQATQKGGMSGKAVEDKSNQLIEYVYKKTAGKYVIIGVGGVFSAEDAYKKIRLGASLIQVITGMIYEGPQLIGDINRGLVKLLERDGYKSIKEAHPRP